MGRLRPEWSEKDGGAESPRSLFAESEGLDLPNALTCSEPDMALSQENPT